MVHFASTRAGRAVARAAIGTVIAVAASAARADAVQLDFNDDAARLTYARPIAGEQLSAEFGWLHHQETGNVVHAGLHLVDAASGGASTLRAGLGGRLFFIDADRDEGSGAALGIGGFLDYTLPQYDRLGVGGHLYFAPDVLGLSDVDGYREAGVYARYNLLREADLYLGLRNVQAEFSDGPDLTFDTGLHIGIKLSF